MSEIEAYSRLFGFDGFEDRVDLVHYVKVCDSAWIEQMKKRSK